MSVFLALVASVGSGTGDFLGGLASRYGRVNAIALWSHIAGIGTTFAVAPIVGGSPSSADLFWGALAGIAGALAILSLYTGFTKSDIAVVSPVAAVGAAGFPVLYAFVTGDRPGGLATVGVAVGIVAIWLVSSGASSTAGGSVRSGVAYGIGAGLGFGGLFVFLSFVGEDAGIWPLVPARAAGAVALLLVGLVAAEELIPHRKSVTPLVGAGALTIVGNAAFILATQQGSLAIVSVLAAMFPATTVILARLVLKERIAPARVLGLALALVAIALVAVA